MTTTTTTTITITGANGTREGNREIRRAARAAVLLSEYSRPVGGPVGDHDYPVTVTSTTGLSYTVTRIGHSTYRLAASWGPTATVTASDAYKVSATWAATVAPTAAAWAAVD